MKAVLLVLIVLLLLSGGADARRKQRVIVVRDYTSAAWGGVVQQVVDDFNAVMPKDGPHLLYERMGEISCVVHPTARESRAISVCSRVMAESGRAHPRQKMIFVSDSYAPSRTAVCHELMHVLTRIPDNNIYDPVTTITTWALPDQSCVWGELSQPGPFDIDYLRKTYERKHR